MLALGVGHGVHEQLAAYLLFRDRLALHELLQLADVLVTVEGDALGVLPVTAGASCLLIVPFDALRDVVMYDKTHVRLVDSHSESDRRHNHVHILHKEPVLILGPGLRVKAGMVRKRADSVYFQQSGNLLNLFAAQAIDDPGFTGMLLYVAYDVLVGIDLVANLIEKVRPVEG